MMSRSLFLGLFVLMSVPGWAEESQKLRAGDPAPGFFVRDFQGKKYSLRPVSLVPGRKLPPQPVYLIDFFATWCKPCRKLLPEVVKMQRAWGHAGLKVLLVDHTESRDIFKKFVQEEGLKLSAVYDMQGRFMANRFGVKELPTTILIGRDFKIVLYMDGEIKDKEAVLNRTLRKLLGPPKITKKGTPATKS